MPQVLANFIMYTSCVLSGSATLGSSTYIAAFISFRNARRLVIHLHSRYEMSVWTSSRIGSGSPDCHWAQWTVMCRAREIIVAVLQCFINWVTCPSPCSKYHGRKPAPAYSVGAYTSALAVFLL
jgi:hypothetical protein